MNEVTVFFQRLASAEYRKAKKWYAKHSETVASNFSNAIDRAVIRISKHPEPLPKIGKKYQNVPVTRFPYIVVFRAMSATSFMIVAVAHTKRRSNYWRRRS